jgi:hypothetical protein
VRLPAPVARAASPRARRSIPRVLAANRERYAFEAPGSMVLRAARRRAKIALACAAILLALALAEAAVRVRARLQGQPYRAAHALRQMRDTVVAMKTTRMPEERPEGELPEPSRQGVVLHPYLGFDWASSAQQIARDSEFFRSAESGASFELLIVGGSVAEAFGRKGGEELERLLEAHAPFGERTVRVLSYGRAAYKQPQQLLLVSYLLGLGFQPDLVVNIDGFNECALANANIELGSHPVHPSTTHWAHLASQRQLDPGVADYLLDMRSLQREASRTLAWTEAGRLHWSALAGTLVRGRLNGLRRQYLANARRYVQYLRTTPSVAVSGPPFPAEPPAPLEIALRNWFESSRSLDAVCRARSIRYLHVLQPTLHDEGSKPLTELELQSSTCDDSWTEGVAFAYPRMRELGAELRRAGVTFLDGSGTFAGVHETLYTDACHFGPAGNALLARRIAAEILEQDSLR